MTVNRLRVLMILLCLLGSASAAPPNAQTLNPSTYTAYRARAIAISHARNEKVIADNFFEAGNLEQAAKLYLHALAAAPDAFSFAEKKHIATRLVKANHRPDAVVILQQLLIEAKSNLPTKLEIVKILAGLPQNSAALAELDAVLKQDSRNKYALLIKADSLRRQKKFSESVPVYRSILQQGHDFDAHLGLVYSLLAVGAKADAKKQFKLIPVEDDAQQEQLDELANTLNSRTRPTLDLLLNHYADSDENRSLEHGVIVRLVTGNIDWVADVRNKIAIADAEDTTATAGTYSLSATANVTDDLRVTGKYGRAKLTAEREALLTTGLLKVAAQVGTGTVTVNVARDALSATPTLISNAIQVSKRAIELKQPLAERLKANLAYAYKSYSDGNTSDDLRAAAYYVVYHGAPQISLGAGYGRVNYKNPTTNGYSAPQNLLAKKLMLTTYYESERLYVDVNIEYGRESYEKNSVYKDNIFHYETATLGMKVTRKLSVELSAERSNSSAAEGAETFDDSVASARLSYLF